MDRYPVTAQGLEKMQTELERLKTVERPQVINAISEARAHGDLKENAEYHAAREQQGFIEARIRDLEAKLSNAQVVDVTRMTNDGKVVFGATVTLENIDNEEQVTYQIVGEDEADLKHNKISLTSPIARAMIGKFVEEEILVKTPQGEIEYAIIKVEYI